MPDLKNCVTLRKMRHTLKNASQVEKRAKLGEMRTLVKMRHTWKYEPHLRIFWHFILVGQYYNQIDGVAMGSPCFG